jgi:hypothetical protein
MILLIRTMIGGSNAKKTDVKSYKKEQKKREAAAARF